MSDLVETGPELYVAKRAIYAGSFDPPTIGHQWVIEQGASLFDELHVAVGVNPDKKPMFSLEERLEMLKNISADFDNVTVGHFGRSFLVHHARANGFDFLLRGLRSADDYNAEKTMESANRDIEPSIRTFYVGCPDELGKVSSSFVKGLTKTERWEEVAGMFVTDFVLEALVRRVDENQQD